RQQQHREDQRMNEDQQQNQWPPRRDRTRPANPCPLCCHAPGVPALRMLSLRDLVARTRAMEIASLTPSQASGPRLGYVVCVDGIPITRVAHPDLVTCHIPEPGDPDYEADLPISGVTCGLLEIDSRVKETLRFITGKAGMRLTRSDLAEKGCRVWPGEKKEV
ncbi:MAG: hypothetical protein M1337_02725, partial [Actinobacteria bacterium]|nr:hypothetical protein [Actinomycetota bacterium]